MKRTVNIGLIGLLFYFLLSSLELQAQHVTESQLDSIKQESINFLIMQNCLEKGRTKAEYMKRIYFSELASEAILGFENIGVYVFGASTSHTKRFFLILDNNSWKILNEEIIASALEDVCSFSIRNKITNEKVIKCTQRIIEIYEYNKTL
jgi:hypothetical protein